MASDVAAYSRLRPSVWGTCWEAVSRTATCVEGSRCGGEGLTVSGWSCLDDNWQRHGCSVVSGRHSSDAALQSGQPSVDGTGRLVAAGPRSGVWAAQQPRSQAPHKDCGTTCASNAAHAVSSQTNFRELRATGTSWIHAIRRRVSDGSVRSEGYQPFTKRRRSSFPTSQRRPP